MRNIWFIEQSLCSRNGIERVFEYTQGTPVATDHTNAELIGFAQSIPVCALILSFCII